MRLAIVGCGSIGRRLAEAADGMAEVKRIYLMDLNGTAAESLAAELNPSVPHMAPEGTSMRAPVVRAVSYTLFL